MQPDVNAPREVLAAALDGGRLVTRAGGIAEAGWDGRVLLASEGGAPTGSGANGRHEQTLPSTPCRRQAPSTAFQTAGAARP